MILHFKQVVVLFMQVWQMGLHGSQVIEVELAMVELSGQVARHWLA